MSATKTKPPTAEELERMVAPPPGGPVWWCSPWSQSGLKEKAELAERVETQFDFRKEIASNRNRLEWGFDREATVWGVAAYRSQFGGEPLHVTRLDAAAPVDPGKVLTLEAGKLQMPAKKLLG
jgi:hypothetical protein